jgi:hypothetical protein
MPESQYSITASISVGSQNPSFVAWNSSTALNTVASLVSNDISYNTLNISLSQTTTITGGVVTFQGSFDGVNFFNLQGFNTSTLALVGATYTLQANTYAVFQFNLTAIPYFQVLLSSAITGTGTVTIGYSADSFVSSLSTTAISGTVGVTQSTTPWVVDGNLTNNNAAPTATLVGVLGAIAETAYTTVTYTTGDMVLPVTDLHGALNQDLQAVAGTALGATAIVNFGSAPAAVAVPAVNSSLFAGVTGITATGTSLNVNVTNPAAPFTVVGNLTNNNAAPNAQNLGVLPAIAETAYTTVTYTTGDQVLPVTDLHGALNHDLQAVAGVAVVTAAAGVQKVGIVGNTGAAMDAAGQNAASPANELLIAGQFNTTPTTITTGNVSPLQVDAIGALKEANSGTSNTAAASWTSATANNTAVTLLSANFSYNTILVTFNQTTTITGGAANFEVSNDNANWVAASGVNYAADGNDIQSYTFQASTYISFKFNIGGWQYFRVRLSPAITGTGTVTVGFAAQSNGVPPTKVQELKDSGRTVVVLYIDNVTAPAAEALQTMSITKNGATTTGTSYTVTAGKTFRMQSMTLASQVNTGIGAVKARIRAAAAVLVTSPIYCTLFASPSTTSGTADVGNAEQVFPDGLEIAAGQQVGISTLSQVNTGNATVCVVGYEY